MADPFDALRLPLTPLAPRRAFAEELRRRIHAALEGGPTREGTPPVTVTALHTNLITRDARAALRFYEEAFGAEVDYVLDMPDGRVGHAELRLGGQVLSLSDEFPEAGFRGPGDGIPPLSLSLYVDDCDAALARAVAAGATVERPAADEFYGHRTAVVRDPVGHRWMLQQPLRDMTPAEMQSALVDDDQGA